MTYLYYQYYHNKKCLSLWHGRLGRLAPRRFSEQLAVLTVSQVCAACCLSLRAWCYPKLLCQTCALAHVETLSGPSREQASPLRLITQVVTFNPFSES